jgi:hypothetical protein
MFDKERDCDINRVKRISRWRPCRAKRGKRRRSPSSHRKRYRKYLQQPQRAAERPAVTTFAGHWFYAAGAHDSQRANSR